MEGHFQGTARNFKLKKNRSIVSVQLLLEISKHSHKRLKVTPRQGYSILNHRAKKEEKKSWEIQFGVKEGKNSLHKFSVYWSDPRHGHETAVGSVVSDKQTARNPSGRPLTFNGLVCTLFLVSCCGLNMILSLGYSQCMLDSCPCHGLAENFR